MYANPHCLKMEESPLMQYEDKNSAELTKTQACRRVSPKLVKSIHPR